MSSSESSSLDGEGSYDCPDYEIEDECFETASKDVEEGEPATYFFFSERPKSPCLDVNISETISPYQKRL